MAGGDGRCMTPVEALERIADLLHRGRAPGHRQQAFRRAAREISRVPDSELRFLADAGRLQDLPGVGDTTAAAIAEALAGQTPEYLQKLLGHTETPGSEGGA